MAIRTPSCPTCANKLVLTSSGELDTWNCGSGHGLGMVLHEAYGSIQEDEIATLWSAVRSTEKLGHKMCPICSKAMLEFDLAYDSDEAPEGETGDGPDEGSVNLEACEPCQMIWFDQDELRRLPGDLTNPEPSQTELSRVADITAKFGSEIEAAMDDRLQAELAERILQKWSRRGASR